MPTIQAFNAASYGMLEVANMSSDLLLGGAEDHLLLFGNYVGATYVGTVSTSLVVYTPRALNSSKQSSYFDDYYNRIHLVPSAVNVGNVLSDTVRTLSLWNAYIAPRSLASIVATGGDGIVVSGVTSPSVMSPSQEIIFSLTVSLSGPAIIDASYTFDFDTEDPVLSVTGARVVVFGYSPNWESPVVEKLEWLTDVMLAYSGDEQRVGLREYPRSGMSYSTMTFDKRQTSTLENLMFGWQSRTWAVPLWMDKQLLSSAVSAGASAIPCTTAGYPFSAGSVVILWTGYNTYEVCEVLSVGASSITLTLPLQSAWGVGTHLYPARLGRMLPRQKFTRESDHHVTGDVEFFFVDSKAETAVDTGDVYLGLNVYGGATNWSDPVEAEFVRQIEELDYSTGLRWHDDLSGLGTVLKNWRWLFKSHSEVVDFKKWLRARAGRLKPFWSMSQHDDITVLADIAAESLSISIQNIGYAKFVNGRRDKAYIAIRAINGTTYYRKIVEAAVINADEESLTIDASLGTQLLVSSIEYVRFIAPTRLDVDSVEIEWHTDEVAESSVMLRSIPL